MSTSQRSTDADKTEDVIKNNRVSANQRKRQSPNTPSSRVTAPFPSERSVSNAFAVGLDYPTIPGHAIPLSHVSQVREFLNRELCTDRLTSIYNYLWMCGRRNNIHPLHWHKMMARNISITEDPSLHLVWYPSTVLVKPLPRCLLYYWFWEDFICPWVGKESLSHEWSRATEIWREANGLLWTYTRLIVHESDHRIARELGLIPDELTWLKWSLMRLDIINTLSDDLPGNVSLRYHYGELRLARLGLVYRVFRFNVLGYHHVYRDYNAFFTATFGWLLLTFAYISVISGSFQVVSGLGETSQSLQNVAYWFSIVVIILVVVVASAQIGLFLGLFCYHLVGTLIQGRRAINM